MVKLSFNLVPYTRELDHTMYMALDQYVAQKLPQAEIEWALKSGEVIELHGIHPDHFRRVAAELGLTDIKDLPFRHKKPRDAFNAQRPLFYRGTRDNGRPVLIVAVIPGKDYLMHYASLVRHLAQQRYTVNSAELVHIYLYPVAERLLASWTGLDGEFVQPGDRIVLGYIVAIRERLEATGRVRLISSADNDYYGSFRYALPDGTVLNLLGVKFCFWGSISEVLVDALCKLGANEILYVSKLGALSAAADLYERVFCPSRYYILNHDQIVFEAPTVPNGVLQRFPEIDSGVHVSVPTVLEEDYKQRNAATGIGANSIDNEISKMARVIAFNRRRPGEKSVLFSALHFATDYVRSLQDRIAATDHDLSKMRDAHAVNKKNRILGRICDEILLPYLLGDEGRPSSELCLSRLAPANPAENGPAAVPPQVVSFPRGTLLRVGVIGAGTHSCENLLPALSLLAGARITAASSRSKERLHALAEHYQVTHRFTDWTEMINSEFVDVVVASAPPQVHKEVLARCLERSIHAFLETPPASDNAHLEAMAL